MGVPTSEVGYTSATTGREDHEVHKGLVVALEEKNIRFRILINMRMKSISYIILE
jgi:hypothetical protein